MDITTIHDLFNDVLCYSNSEQRVKKFLSEIRLRDDYLPDEFIVDFLTRGIVSSHLKNKAGGELLQCIHRNYRDNKCPEFYSDRTIDTIIVFKLANFSIFEGWVPDERVPALLERGVVPINSVKGNEELFLKAIPILQMYYPLDLSGFNPPDTSEYFLDGLNIDFETLSTSTKYLAKIIEYNFFSSENITVVTNSLELFGKKSILTDKILTHPMVYRMVLYSNMNIKLNKKSGLSEELVQEDPNVINKLADSYLTRKLITEFFKIKPRCFYFKTHLVKRIKLLGFDSEIDKINPILLEDPHSIADEKAIAELANVDVDELFIISLLKITDQAKYYEKYPIVLKAHIKKHNISMDRFTNELEYLQVHRVIPREDWLKELLLEI